VQARARRTRDKIIDQAKQAFAIRGYEATNLTDHILAPAGVSVGSFYHQFANKREVLLEIFATTISERYATVLERLSDGSSTSFGEAYHAILEALLDDVDRNPDVWRIQLREHESPDPEIRRVALVGLGGWSDVALGVMRPWYPDDHPNVHVAANMVALLSTALVREYTHFTTEEQGERRESLVGTCVAFAEAGLDRLLAGA